MGKNDWSRCIAGEPEMYEQEELERPFTAGSEEERLMTDLREQEVMYTY